MAFRPYFTAYCDGASRKDGRGGWGFVVYDREGFEIDYKCGGEYNTSNNKMELQGAIEALRWAKQYKKAGNRLPIMKIISDSQYVIKGITEHMDLWLRTGWRTSANKPLKNVDLWEILGHLDCDVLPDWRWVKGHTGDIGNERADELAGKGVPPAEQPLT